jgi:hypothetical protein
MKQRPQMLFPILARACERRFSAVHRMSRLRSLLIDALPRERRRNTNTSEQPHITERVYAEDIARRAYERFLRRGAEDGREVEDWLEAERQPLLAVAPSHAA